MKNVDLNKGYLISTMDYLFNSLFGKGYDFSESFIYPSNGEQFKVLDLDLLEDKRYVIEDWVTHLYVTKEKYEIIHS